MNLAPIAQWGKTILKVSALVACGLVLWLSGCARSPVSGDSSAVEALEAARFISKQAPVVVSLSQKPEQVLSQIKGLDRPDKLLQNTLLDNTGLDYKQDIQPWLDGGGIWAMTSTDVDRQGENGQQPGYLVVLPTKNTQLSQELLEVYWQREAIAGQDLVFEPYKGTQLIYSREENQISTTVVGSRFVLLANHPKVLKEAINNVQVAELSLGATPDYQELQELNSEKREAISWLNLPRLAQKLGMEVDHPMYQALGMAVQLQPEGVLAQTHWLPTDPALLEGAEAPLNSSSLLAYLPSSSYLAIDGVNLRQFWQQMQTETAGYGNIAEIIRQPLLDWGKQWQLDVEADILDAIEGEFAIAFLPDEAEGDLDWIVIRENTGESLSDRLDQILNQQGFSIGSFQLDDQTLVAWTQLIADPVTDGEQTAKSRVLKAKVQGVHTTLNQYEIITSSIAAMDRVLKAKATGNSLATNALFQASIAPLPEVNQGYFFINWRSAQKPLERQIPLLRLVELAAKPLFDPLESVAIASYGDAQERQADIFLNTGSERR
ncbi:MAG: DUF3352 domain-containing protein [Roseofilum sp. SBFL]|uniref:DUF3352 domain-containing protein n=1 Tax=unclassified Roseofilum TaxID=2620099 RepID=UPI001B1958C9|nr:MULTISPECIES: DUF3352 domain-containing protein [unclassified Roseofilum]MBP0015381.1 DUF3352 domain-containing protein [Roseofilum sp. SID3]MBP0026306.1 DUF3352 domain-containing protein [Roseofilum sp. SID2]MBP0036626.1 DUF3352 domain-containing protein [Roseofilum sp. SID1]MBP0041267.1 DUF3352 domain-containing protein [Roseofilum sp. SBFL]